MAQVTSVPEAEIREQLAKFSRDLRYLAAAEAKPVSVLLAEARARFDQIAAGAGEDTEFNRITAAELATAKFDLTYLVEGVLA